MAGLDCLSSLFVFNYQEPFQSHHMLMPASFTSSPECRRHCGALQVVVDVRGQQLSLSILAVLEFNSDRKRMSILCRLPDGR